MKRRNVLQSAMGVVLGGPLARIEPTIADQPSDVDVVSCEDACECPRCTARRALGIWMREQMDNNVIAALGGLK